MREGVVAVEKSTGYRFLSFQTIDLSYSRPLGLESNWSDRTHWNPLLEFNLAFWIVLLWVVPQNYPHWLEFYRKGSRGSLPLGQLIIATRFWHLAGRKLNELKMMVLYLKRRPMWDPNFIINLIIKIRWSSSSCVSNLVTVSSSVEVVGLHSLGSSLSPFLPAIKYQGLDP